MFTKNPSDVKEHGNVFNACSLASLTDELSGFSFERTEKVFYFPYELSCQMSARDQ